MSIMDPIDVSDYARNAHLGGDAVPRKTTAKMRGPSRPKIQKLNTF